MATNKTFKHSESRTNDRYFCTFCNQPCIYHSLIPSPPEIKKYTSSYKGIIRCLKCPKLKANISSNPNLDIFFRTLGNHFLTLLQKTELDQMILNKQEFSLENIRKKTADNRLEQHRQERALQDMITHYESLLKKRGVYLQTLQTLSMIISKTPDPDKIWKRTSFLLTRRLLDLEAVGLVILQKDSSTIKQRYTSLLPVRLSKFIDGCLDCHRFCLWFADNEIFVSLYQVFWEGYSSQKRPGPRIEDMLERCLLFPVKAHLSLTGVFIVLMKHLSSSIEEMAPFFLTAARLIEGGIISVT
ncbi:MAG: hypothetical protein ACMUIM_04670 [bacterium]